MRDSPPPRDVRVALSNSPRYGLEIVNELDLSQNVLETALDVAITAELDNGIRRKYSNIASAAVYISGLIHNANLSMKEIREVNGLSNRSIRGAYYDILRSDSDLPQPPAEQTNGDLEGAGRFFVDESRDVFYN